MNDHMLWAVSRTAVSRAGAGAHVPHDGRRGATGTTGVGGLFGGAHAVAARFRGGRIAAVCTGGDASPEELLRCTASD